MAKKKGQKKNNRPKVRPFQCHWCKHPLKATEKDTYKFIPIGKFSRNGMRLQKPACPACIKKKKLDKQLEKYKVRVRKKLFKDPPQPEPEPDSTPVNQPDKGLFEYE